MILQVGDSIEKFIGLGQARRDSFALAMVKSEVHEINMGEAYQVIGKPSIDQSRLFKFKNKRKYHHKGVLGRNTFVCIEPMDGLMQWKIKSDTMSILGYKCQKATTHFAGRDYIAWFTTELPLRAAPYKFDGLPGTMVSLEDVRGHYNFELVGVQSASGGEKITTLPSIKYINLKRKEVFEQRVKLTQMTLYEVLTMNGTEIHGLENSPKSRKKFTFRNNNPIELE
jgi:GLPGLI family protein